MTDIKLKPIILDQPQINEFYKTFGSGSETTVNGVTKFMDVDEIIARDVVAKSSTQMPGIFTYENLKDGTAPLFDLLPIFKDLSPNERIKSLGTNDKIINFLTRTPKGEKLEFGTISEGFKRDILLCGRGEPATHKEYQTILELLHHPDRTWRTCLTSNGYKIDKYWDFYTNNFDNIILNTYSTKEEYDERVEKYGWKLNTSGKHGTDKKHVYNLEHYFKPDLLQFFTSDELSKFI